MKLEDAINFFTDYDTEPYRDLQGNQRRHRLTITALVNLQPARASRYGGGTHSFVAGIDRRLAVQHHWRDPVRPPAWLQRRRHPARSRCGRCRRASSRSSAGSTTAAPRSTTRAPTARSPGASSVRTTTASSSRASTTSTSRPSRCGRSRCSRTPPIGGGNTLQIRVETFNVFNVRDLRRPEHGSAIGELRDRGHREPGQLPAHHPDRTGFRF